jgi:hypothetical protein
MPNSWPHLLFRLLTAGVSSAAGAAASAAAVANPILGAAASSAAQQLAEQLLKQFLPAQQEAVQRMEQLQTDVHLLTGDIGTRVRSLQEGSWRAARLHIEDAALHPERAAEELQAARRLLYEAWGAATDPGQRSFAAQELSGVYAFLGHHDDSIRWLERSLPDSDLAVAAAIETFLRSVSQLPDKAPPRPSAGEFIKVSMRFRRVYASADKIVPAVQGLVEACYDALDLRKRATAVGAGRPWPLAGSKVELSHSGEILLSTPGEGAAVDLLDYGSQVLTPEVRAMLRAIQTMRFSIADGPWLKRPGRTYVVGSSPELGEWDPALAILLAPRPRSSSTISSTVWTPQRSIQEAVIQVLDDGNAEIKYFFLPDDTGSINWEPGTRRAKVYSPSSFYGTSGMFAPAAEVWGNV